MTDIRRIAEDTTRREYAVRGRDPVTGRLWLAVTDETYDGYDGDLILAPAPDGSYDVVLADSRTSLPARINLEA